MAVLPHDPAIALSDDGEQQPGQCDDARAGSAHSFAVDQQAKLFLEAEGGNVWHAPLFFERGHTGETKIDQPWFSWMGEHGYPFSFSRAMSSRAMSSRAMRSHSRPGLRK